MLCRFACVFGAARNLAVDTDGIKMISFYCNQEDERSLTGSSGAPLRNRIVLKNADRLGAHVT